MAVDALLAKFPSKVALKGSDLYAAENAKYWSAASVLEPEAIFLPANTTDVSEGVKLLVSFDAPFAIRSGGHMPIVGAAGRNGGILISLSGMKAIEFLENDTLMRIEAGVRWGEVYAAAEEEGKVVVGGRCGDVGIGLILGGGLSLLSGTYGLVCDNVTEFEVVLASGEVVQANQHDHADLFWALKGGSNNFGLVTKVVLKTYPSVMGWGGTAFFLADQAEQFNAAVQQFMRDGINDPKAGIVPVWVAKTNKAPAMLLAMMFYADETAYPACFKPFTDIPMFKNNFRLASLRDIISGHVSGGQDGMRRAFIAGSVVGSPEAVDILGRAVFKPDTVNRFTKIPGITVAQALQPITAPMLTAGSHALTVDVSKAPFIWYCITVIWTDAANDSLAHTALKDAQHAIQTAAAAQGLDDPFIYMNEGAGMPAQPGYESFGFEAISKLIAIRDRYDPDGKLRSLLAGAWKLPARV